MHAAAAIVPVALAIVATAVAWAWVIHAQGAERLWGRFPTSLHTPLLVSAIVAYVCNAALVVWLAVDASAHDDVEMQIVTWATVAYYALATVCAPLLALAVNGQLPHVVVSCTLIAAVVPMVIVAYVTARHGARQGWSGFSAAKLMLACTSLAHVTVGDAILFGFLF